jgi:uncharacterized protein YjbJ (UPF0337 family)
MNEELSDSTKRNVDEVVGAGTADKIEGSAKETVGRGKEAIGAATGNDSLRADGVKDQAEGKAQGLLGEIKEGVEHLVDEVKGVFHHHDKTE